MDDDKEYCTIKKLEKKDIDDLKDFVINLEKENKEKFKKVEGLLYYNNTFLKKCDVLYIAYNASNHDLCGEAQVTVKENFIVIDKMVTRNHNGIEKVDKKFNRIGTKIIQKIIEDYKDDEKMIGIYVASFKESIGFYEKKGFIKINDKFMCYYLKNAKTLHGSIKKEDIDKVLNFFDDKVFYKETDGRKSKRRKKSKSKSIKKEIKKKRKSRKIKKNL